MRPQNNHLAYTSNKLHTTPSPACVDTSTIKCFTTHEFIGDSDPSSSIPTGQLDLTSTPYNRFTSFVFDSCLFRNCKADYGGGIYLNMSNSHVSLTVSKGEFYSCKADPYRGGGIYAEGMGEVTIQESLFYSCVAEAAGDYGGGGIEIAFVHKPPRIEATAFILCTSGNDGSGLGIWNAMEFQKTCVKVCRFIECEGNDPSSSGGGGMLVWESQAAIGCSECLFSKCNSAFVGGAFAYYIIAQGSFVERPLVSFCFYNENAAQENCGNDAYFVEWIPNDPFLHSFSTSNSWRVTYVSQFGYIYRPGTYQNADIWLP